MKILLLEDETMIQMLIEDYINDLGLYEVIPTSNLEEAMAVEEHYDFALLDINLGDGTNSFPLAELLTARGVPFVFMTGYHAQSIERFEEVRKLSKPINFPMLVKTLQEFAQR
jgi:CheY-like chemotaxis protein